ncbi:PH (Pleckstrin Homology) domain-containing protein [Dyadobacter jejuensis]|uniref:PH (Pleckstrin Homology) domain-containing protein n=1 Tax=Dyadobacter jejuensis TaxID=1082580 RepID=A0A316AQP7_9BACT|nr:DUF3784 domain-containing protein [Dyadobacter jejuensis]PWJ60053.1 PH (Pleckstrin Homology) domain-containing protein [Dyadobacter jejuensis]
MFSFLYAIPMLYVTAFISLVFISLGFGLTTKNARYLLSGYNTMSEEQRAKVDIQALVPYFKRFHIFLGISLFVGTSLLWLVDWNLASLFMTTYPLFAYGYFLWRAAKFYQDRTHVKRNYFVTGFMLLLALVIGFFEIKGFKGNDLLIQEDALVIEGSYGMVIPRQQVKEINMVERIPPISIKVNGFAAGYMAKGSFKTQDGKVVKLFVNKKYPQAIYIRTDQHDVYYNATPEQMKSLYAQLTNWEGK